MEAEVCGVVDRSDGAQLRWWRAGRGEPVVLVHGSFTDHRVWSGALPDMAARSDVTSYDRRGHSTSSNPSGGVGVNLDAGDLLALIDTVIGGPAHLVGHCYGASVALAAALARPEAVRSLAVYEPPLYGMLDHDPVADVLGAEAGVWWSHAAELIRDGNPEAGTRVFMEKASLGKGSWTGLLTEEQRFTMVNNAASWLEQYDEGSSRSLDITPLAGAQFPVTLIAGEHTGELNQMLAYELVDRLPRARTVTLRGAGHGGHLTHSRELAAALLEHLKSR